jgi:hypothetical protein
LFLPSFPSKIKPTKKIAVSQAEARKNKYNTWNIWPYASIDAAAGASPFRKKYMEYLRSTLTSSKQNKM